jgi:hypothetical protein
LEVFAVAHLLSSDSVTNRRSSSDRRNNDRREQSVPVVEQRQVSERRKVQRRRQIDPTTCERDYSTEEIEFMQAMDAYKRASGRMFPTCSEILEVIRGLGYGKLPTETMLNDNNGSDEPPAEDLLETVA